MNYSFALSAEKTTVGRGDQRHASVVMGIPSHPFPPLAPQLPIHKRYRLPFGGASSQPVRALTQFLPEISLPWLEIGLVTVLLAMLRLS